MEKLPAENSECILPFPKTKGMHFYTHGYLDWNPQGHIPVGIYDKPHFDFHFYIISNEARMAIGANDNIQFATYPDPIYRPLFLHAYSGRGSADGGALD